MHSDFDQAPKDDVASKVDKMNTLSGTVEAVYAKLKDYVPSEVCLKYDSLPELGPYRYKDGSTYQGQYLSGLKNGFGKSI